MFDKRLLDGMQLTAGPAQPLDGRNAATAHLES
jgi:hypothetical protein